MAVNFISEGNFNTRRRNLKKTSACQTSLTNFTTYCCIEYTSPWAWFELTTVVEISTDCIVSGKSNYHTITTPMVPICNWKGIESCMSSDEKACCRGYNPPTLRRNLQNIYLKPCKEHSSLQTHYLVRPIFKISVLWHDTPSLYASYGLARQLLTVYLIGPWYEGIMQKLSLLFIS